MYNDLPEGVSSCKVSTNPNRSVPSYIQTYSGILFNLLDPNPDSIRVEDIIHALSHMCRFGGHVKHFYSVLDHSLLVADIVKSRGGDELEALCHDMTEAYLQDIVKPLKVNLDEYNVIEERLYTIIAKYFGVSTSKSPDCEFGDQVALSTEALCLFSKRMDWMDQYPLPVKTRAIPPGIFNLVWRLRIKLGEWNILPRRDDIMILRNPKETRKIFKKRLDKLTAPVYN